MEDINDLLYDDVEAKLTEIKDKKERRKKRYKNVKKYTLLGMILFVIFYFISDYSKIKSLYTNGNKFYTDQEIYDKAGISYNTRYILVPSFYIKWKLEQDPVIDEVSVHKNMSGAISIDITENKVIGYTVLGEGEEATTNIVLSDGTTVALSETNLNSIVHYPLLTGFDEEQLTKLAVSFDQEKQAVDEGVIGMIAEIKSFSTSYDEHMVKIIMQDGNKIYSTYNGVRLLTRYKEAVSVLKGNKVCLMVEESNDALIKSDCLD